MLKHALHNILSFFSIKKSSSFRDEDNFIYKPIVDTTPDPIIHLDKDFRVKYISKNFAKEFNIDLKDMVGLTPEEVSQKTLNVNKFGAVSNTTKLAYEAMVRVKDTLETDVYFYWADSKHGRTCHEVRHVPEFDKNGEFIGILAFTRDITEQGRLSDLANFLGNIGNPTDGSFYGKTAEYIGILLGMEYVLVQTLNKSTKLLEAKAAYGLNTITYPFEGSICERSLTLTTQGYSGDICGYNPNDSLLQSLPVNSGASIPLRGVDNNVLGFLTLLSTKNIPKGKGQGMKELVHILASRIVAELENERLKDSEAARAEDFRVLVENSPDLISRYNSEGNIVYLNPAIQALGYDLSGPLPSHASPDAHKTLFENIQSVLRTGKNIQFVDEVLPFNSTSIKYIDVNISAELNKKGKVIGVLVVGRNITDRIKLEEKLRKQASVDHLTGLPNRRVFFDNLELEIVKAKRHKKQAALLFIDLDRFKEINDSLGHHAGDTLLKESAHRIRNSMRKSDMVARLGGDEFVVLLTDIKDPIHASEVADNIIKLLSEPYNFDGILGYVSASIGIAIFPNDATTSNDLITFADQAMYSAKTHGRSTFKFFTPEMQAASNERVSMVNDLRGALNNNEMSVFYQPIIDLSSNKVIKAEALIRWFHPERGMVRPDQFIPLAEDTGLIDEIGDWVFKQSISMAARWCKKENYPRQVSINISPRQFNQENIVQRWLGWIKEINLPAHCVTLELTESLLLGEQEGLQAKLAGLRDAGVQLALDDFGTGYSAMAYLKKFNIDFLKIDGSFIRDMTEDESDCAIAETIIVMASKLGMKSIAECVETDAQKNLLKGFGCDYVQGYFYAKPMPEEDFFDYLGKR